jgi:hypothetical protein
MGSHGRTGLAHVLLGAWPTVSFGMRLVLVGGAVAEGGGK